MSEEIKHLTREKKKKNDTSHAHKTTHKKKRAGKKMKRKRPEKGLEERGSIVPQILPRVKRGTVHSTLRLRETSVPKPGRNVHRLRAFYRAIVPDNTVSCYLIFVLDICVYICISLSLSLSLLTNADFGALVPLSLFINALFTDTSDVFPGRPRETVHRLRTVPCLFQSKFVRRVRVPVSRDIARVRKMSRERTEGRRAQRDWEALLEL